MFSLVLCFFTTSTVLAQSKNPKSNLRVTKKERVKVGNAVLSKTSQTAIKKKVKTFKTYNFDVKSIHQQVSRTGTNRITLPMEENVIVDLKRNDKLYENCIVEAVGKNGKKRLSYTPNVYKGTTTDGRKVRLQITDNTFDGIVYDKKGKKTYIRSAKKFTKNQAEQHVVVFKEDDIIREALKEIKPTNVISPLSFSARNYNPSFNYRDESAFDYMLEIAADVDFFYYQKLGSSTENVYNDIMNVLNLAEAAYEEAFNLTFNVKYIHIWTDITDDYPYSRTDNVTTLLPALNQVADYWNNNMSHIDRDVVHLFTGLGSNLGEWGWSWVGCVGNSNAYSLSRMRDEMYETTTHELGHNLGAYDVNLQGSASDIANCKCRTSEASVMCQGQKSNDLWFCDYSKTEIEAGITNFAGLLAVSKDYREDCLRYDPRNLRIEQYKDYWQLTDGRMIMEIFDNKEDAENGMKVAKRHTYQCFIGRNNKRSNRKDFIFTYWKGESGLPEEKLSKVDEIRYDNQRLTIDYEPNGKYWVIAENHNHSMFIADNLADAVAMLNEVRKHSKSCFIGRDNRRSDRKSFIMQYME